MLKSVLTVWMEKESELTSPLALLFVIHLDLGSVWIELILLKLKTENTVAK